MQVNWGKRVAQIAIVGAGLLVLAVSLGKTIPAQAARAALVPSGVTAIFGIDEGGVVGRSAEAATLASATGVRWVRGEVSWNSLEPVQGVYNFTEAEGNINQLLNANLVPIMYISDNPSWAANTRCGPVDTTDPDRVTAFANAIGALAAHFPQVTTWALYNEVDRSVNFERGAGCFGASSAGGVNHNGVKDSKEYAILLAAAWKAVHDANPNAQLVMGALAFDNFDSSAPSTYPGQHNGDFNYNFTTDLFGYMKKNPLPDGQKYMDMVLFNYYDIYGRYWERNAPGRGIQAKAAALKNKIKQAKIPVVPLFVTETGEDSYSIGLSAQARCLDITLVRGAAAKLKGVVWWTFQDLPDDADPPYNTWKFGVVDQNMQPKPSYTALLTLTTQLNNYTYKKNLSGTANFVNVEAYRFVDGGSMKYVVWSSSYKSTSYDPECSWARNSKLATFDAKAIRTVDYMGKAKLIKDNGKKDKDKTKGKIGIMLTGNPQIVEINP